MDIELFYLGFNSNNGRKTQQKTNKFYRQKHYNMTEAEIDLIIQEAELNPPDNYWQFVTDTADDLRFISETIRINGSISIEEY